MNFCFQDFCVLFETFTYDCFYLLFFHAPGQCLFWRDPFQHRLSHEPFSGQHDSLPKDHSLRLCGSFKRTLEPEHKLHLLFIFMIYYWLVLSTILILDFVRDCSRQYPKVGRVECLSALFIFTNCIYWICPRELALIWYLWFIW